MKRYGLLTALVWLSSSWAAEGPGFVVTHHDALQRVTLDGVAPAGKHKVREATPFHLSFYALGQAFSLELEPNDRVLSPKSRAALPDDVTLHRGRLSGKSGSWVRIVMIEGAPQGLIWDGAEMYAVEAPTHNSVGADYAVVYRLADTYVTPGTMSCGTSMAAGSAAAMYSNLVGELSSAQAAGPGATSELQLSSIGDFEFVERHGADAEAAIATRLNNVDGIFSEQLGVQLTVDAVELHTDPEDPFTDTLDSGELLEELSDYRFNSQEHSGHGLTHLYTGRNLAGTTVGIAYVNALCSRRFGAGLTEGRSGPTFDSLVAAHEIGHNFGAPHDAEEGSACEAESEDFLMAASLNGSDQFSQCSIAQIEPRIANAACITTLPTVDVSISSSEDRTTAALGTDVSVTFDVNNAGTLEATGVRTEVTLSEGFAFVSAQSSVGSCTSGAGTVECQLGAIPAGANRSVTVTATATQVGWVGMDAAVSADVDDNPGNNDTAVSLDIIEAVDLSVRALPVTQVGLNQSTTIRVGLNNLSALDATGVALSISLGQGLRADSASWSLGACSVEAQRIDCESDNFAGHGSATVDFVVTGTTSGAKGYTVTISSSELDSNTADNTRDGNVTVGAATSDASSGGGGGGGSAGLVFLCLIAFTRACTAFRTRIPILTTITPLGLIRRSLQGPGITL